VILTELSELAERAKTACAYHIGGRHFHIKYIGFNPEDRMERSSSPPIIHICEFTCGFSLFNLVQKNVVCLLSI